MLIWNQFNYQVAFVVTAAFPFAANFDLAWQEISHDCGCRRYWHQWLLLHNYHACYQYINPYIYYYCTPLVAPLLAPLLAPLIIANCCQVECILWLSFISFLPLTANLIFVICCMANVCLPPLLLPNGLNQFTFYAGQIKTATSFGQLE